MNPCRLRAIEPPPHPPGYGIKTYGRFHAQITRHPELRTSSFCGNAEKKKKRKKKGGFAGYFQLMSWRDSENLGFEHLTQRTDRVDVVAGWIRPTTEKGFRDEGFASNSDGKRRGHTRPRASASPVASTFPSPLKYIILQLSSAFS